MEVMLVSSELLHMVWGVQSYLLASNLMSVHN